jgi:hypothetical protein
MKDLVGPAPSELPAKYPEYRGKASFYEVLPVREAGTAKAGDAVFLEKQISSKERARGVFGLTLLCASSAEAPTSAGPLKNPRPSNALGLMWHRVQLCWGPQVTPLEILPPWAYFGPQIHYALEGYYLFNRQLPRRMEDLGKFFGRRSA